MMQEQQDRGSVLRLGQVMNYVRSDGPVDAPVCFLTIEDGGRFTFESVDDFMGRCFCPANESWERTPECTEKFGKPGQFMAKIILALCCESIEGWRQYRDGSLHARSETNIKFYPIPRRNTREWKPVFSEAIGLSMAEYLARCWTERPQIIFRKLTKMFHADRLHLILGAKLEWVAFLRHYVYPDASPCVAPRDSRGRTRYAIYCRADETLAFACFDIFRPGCRNDDILEFAATLRSYMGDAGNHEALFRRIKSTFDYCRGSGCG